MSMKEKRVSTEEEFDEFRLNHLRLAYSVELLDRCYREFIGIAVLLYILGILLLLYMMTDWNGNCIHGVFMILYPFWTLLIAALLIFIVIFAAIIHSLVIIFSGYHSHVIRFFLSFFLVFI